MHTILLKMNTKRCRFNFLPRYMDATIDHLLSLSKSRFPGQRDVYKEQICIATATALPSHDILAYLQDEPYRGSVKVKPNVDRADPVGMLAAAAATGNQTALRFLIGKVRSASTSSEVYGTPLLAAAANGHVRVARFIYRRMRGGVQRGGKLRSKLWYAIELCIRKGRVAMLPTLLEWYLRLPTSPNKVFESKAWFLNWAIQTGNLEILKMCYDQAPRADHNCGLKMNEFRDACYFGHTNIIEYFLSQSVPQLCKWKHDSFHLTRGLWAAAERGWLVATKMLLEHGASVGVLKDSKGMRLGSVIHWAVKSGNVDVVVLLLAYGAKVPMYNGTILSGGLSTEQMAQQQGGAMARMIRQAIRQQFELL
jgi:hypothetical protein